MQWCVATLAVGAVIWCGVHGCVARVTSTFGAACIGVLQGLHQHYRHVARFTSSFGAVCMSMLQGLHQHLVQRAWVCCTRVTSTVGAVCKGMACTGML